jgi:hypothetical protein
MTASFGRVLAIHSGLSAAALIVRNVAGAGRISQPVTLQPHITYAFSAWAAASVANPGCDVLYYIGSPDGMVVSQVLASVPSAKLGGYVESTATYTSGDDTEVSVNVMVSCSQAAGTHGFYFDDITLTPVA